MTSRSTTNRDSFSYQSAQERAPLVRRFWKTLEQERNSSGDDVDGDPAHTSSANSNPYVDFDGVGGLSLSPPRTHHYGSFAAAISTDNAADQDDGVDAPIIVPSSASSSSLLDLSHEALPLPVAASSSSSVPHDRVYQQLEKSPPRVRTATVETAALSDSECAREVHASLTALLLETGPYATETSAMSMLVALFGADASNELAAAATAVARRRGRDLALAAATLSNELVAFLASADGVLDGAGIRNALGSLLRGNSTATKVAREFLRVRCAAWLVQHVGGALGASVAPLEVDPAKAASPQAAAGDLARLENLSQQVLSAILLAGASDLPEEVFILAHTVRNSVQFALDQHMRSTARKSRREVFDAATATAPEAPTTRGRRSSSAPRDRVRKLASRRVVVAAEVDRLRQQIGAGDKSTQTAAAMQRKEIELTDIDRETDAIAVSPTTYMRESHFGKPEARAFHICMTGIFFLRFVCPALIAPHQNGLRAAPPSAGESRTLLLLAKVIQQLSNDVEFGRKEDFMAPLSRMHHRNREPLRRFFVFLADEGQRRLARSEASQRSQYAAAPAKTSDHYQSLANIKANLPSSKLSCAPAGGAEGDADDLADVTRLVAELRRHLRSSAIDWSRPPYNSAQWQRVSVLVGARTDVATADAHAAHAASEPAATAYVEIPLNLERRPEPAADRASERLRKLERIRLLLGVKLNAMREVFEQWRARAVAFASVADAIQNKKLLAALVELKAVLPDAGAAAAPFAMPPLSAAQLADAKLAEIVGKLLATLWVVDQRVVALSARVLASTDKDSATAIAEVVKRAQAVIMSV